MNIDKLISDFDFDQINSDCLIHVSLQTYLKKKAELSACDASEARILTEQFKNYSDILSRCLNKALCFPTDCKDCVGMQKCANCLKQEDLGETFVELHKYL